MYGEEPPIPSRGVVLHRGPASRGSHDDGGGVQQISRTFGHGLIHEWIRLQTLLVSDIHNFRQSGSN